MPERLSHGLEIFQLSMHDSNFLNKSWLKITETSSERMCFNFNRRQINRTLWEIRSYFTLQLHLVCGRNFFASNRKYKLNYDLDCASVLLQWISLEIREWNSDRLRTFFGELFEKFWHIYVYTCMCAQSFASDYEFGDIFWVVKWIATSSKILDSASIKSFDALSALVCIIPAIIVWSSNQIFTPSSRVFPNFPSHLLSS